MNRGKFDYRIVFLSNLKFKKMTKLEEREERVKNSYHNYLVGKNEENTISYPKDCSYC